MNNWREIRQAVKRSGSSVEVKFEVKSVWK